MLILVFVLAFLWAVPSYASTFFDTDFETCAASAGNDWPCESWNDFGSEAVCTTNRLQVLSGSAFSGTKFTRLTYNNVNGSTCQPAIHHTITASNHIFFRVAIRQSSGFQIGSNGASKRMRWRPANTNDPNPSDGLGPYPIFWFYTYSGQGGVPGTYAFNIEQPCDQLPGGFWLTSGSLPTADGWDQVEGEIIMNTNGQANGGLRMWVNGVLKIEQLNRKWVSATPTGVCANGLWRPSDWFANNTEIFLQSGVGTLDYDRVAIGNTRIGLVGSAPAPDTTPPTPPTNPTAQ